MIFHKQRGEARKVIAVEARMRIGDCEVEATLINASSRGVLAATANPPVRGTKVELAVGGLVLPGHVRWHGTDCCGIALRDPISVADLIEGHAVPVTYARQPKGMSGVTGLWRALLGEFPLNPRGAQHH